METGGRAGSPGRGLPRRRARQPIRLDRRDRPRRRHPRRQRAMESAGRRVRGPAPGRQLSEILRFLHGRLRRPMQGSREWNSGRLARLQVQFLYEVPLPRARQGAMVQNGGQPAERPRRTAWRGDRALRHHRRGEPARGEGPPGGRPAVRGQCHFHYRRRRPPRLGQRGFSPRGRFRRAGAGRSTRARWRTEAPRDYRGLQANPPGLVRPSDSTEPVGRFPHGGANRDAGPRCLGSDQSSRGGAPRHHALAGGSASDHVHGRA